MELKMTKGLHFEHADCHMVAKLLPILHNIFPLMSIKIYTLTEMVVSEADVEIATPHSIADYD